MCSLAFRYNAWIYIISGMLRVILILCLVCKTIVLIFFRLSGRIHLTKRAKARLLIVISWVAPMSLVTGSSSSDWNCRNLCCPPGYYNSDSCPVEQSCSRLWPPLTQSFLAIVLGVWIMEVKLINIYRYILIYFKWVIKVMCNIKLYS